MGGRKNWSAEQIIAKLRQIEVQMAQGRGLSLAKPKRPRSPSREFQDECLKREIFHSLREAQVVIAAWQDRYNHIRPHSSLGYRSPAPITLQEIARQLSLPAAVQASHTLRSKGPVRSARAVTS